MRRQWFPAAGSFHDSLVTCVGQAAMVQLPGMGSSKRLSNSSTAWLLVMTQLNDR